MSSTLWLRLLAHRWLGRPGQRVYSSRPAVSARRQAVRCSARPHLELLEDRTLLSAPVSTTGDLITAIKNANAAGGLTPITLAANTTFDFTTANNSTNGHNALPVITGNIIIVGKGGDLLSRDNKSTTPFRLFDVASGGSLILENLTLQGGLVQG